MASWSIDNLPWHRFDPSRVDGTMLALAKSAALVEFNSHEYGRYLRQVFAEDQPLCLAIERWSSEEVQHGQALRRWCELADPGFDFDSAFTRFTARIRLPDGSGGSVRGSRAGELLARCVVECGTSMYYSCLGDQVQEPVLRHICSLIARDEFNHYRLFYSQSRRWMAREPLPLWSRLQVVLGRMVESEDDELAYAWYCSSPGDAAYRRRQVLGRYLLASLSVLRCEHMERSLTMVMRAAGLPGSKRWMRTLAMLSMRVVRWRIRRLASSGAHTGTAAPPIAFSAVSQRPTDPLPHALTA